MHISVNCMDLIEKINIFVFKATFKESELLELNCYQ